MILVVDDDDCNRELLFKIVRSSGHEAIKASNGLEAVAIFRSRPDSIDLVITDLKMPMMDGNEAVRRIRETRPNVAIVCVSGDSERERPAGTRFLSKPFTVGQLRSCVSEALAVHVQ